MPTPPLDSFDAIYTHLITAYPPPVLPSASPNARNKALTHTIASLTIHPTLEALLHILNADLTSAHFLCRHMQNKPAWEGMYIHGLLHRIEGDYRNADAWYRNVHETEVFRNSWPGQNEEGLENAQAFIGRVEKLRKQKVGDKKALEQESGREIDALVQWCKNKFGTGRFEDATKAWVEPEEHLRAIAAKMIVGGEGWRNF